MRSRDGDVECLVKYALSKLEGANKLAPDQNALAKLRAYNWPGNVRELINMMERHVMDSVGSSLRAPDLASFLTPELQWIEMTDLNSAPAPGHRSNASERVRIISALEENGWHQIRTAKQQGMDRTTLYRKMRIHGLSKHA